MQLPYFFEENIPATGNFVISEESSRHIVRVLRMKEGEKINITNGRGQLLTASISIANKKKAEVFITQARSFPQSDRKISIAISPVKNSSRFEWFLEKATEIGVLEIIPLLCERTEKHALKTDRMRNIIVSAMLQSRQTWMPALREPLKFAEIPLTEGYQQKLIAHCNDLEKKTLKDLERLPASQIILIGPEGDFTLDEINTALKKNYVSVSLGKTRLRTETAGIVAAVLLMNK